MIISYFLLTIKKKKIHALNCQTVDKAPEPRLKDTLCFVISEKKFFIDYLQTYFDFFNHNHPLNGWFVLPLEGAVTCGGPLKKAPNELTITLFFRTAPKGAFYLSFFTGSPVNGSIYSFILNWSFIMSSFN